MKRLLFFAFVPLFSVYSEYGIIKGFVSDAENGERLSYADVILKNTTLGTSTDEKGYYYISRIPEGEYTVIFSYLGYEPTEKKVEIKGGQVLTLNIELRQSSIVVPGVVVSAERERFEKSVEVSHITFTQQEIKSVPGLFESDLIKSLQLMPGVVGMHDLSSKLYVRGGSPDENLVLLDGITIYNPATHLFGLFSTFQPDAVKEAELYAGGFPAKYGDRLSAVLDVSTKEGNSKKYEGNASVGLITSKLLIEGPIPNGSFLFSGRRTYFDALIWGYAHIFNKDVELPYYFYDGVGKINYNFSSDNKLTLTGFGGADVISFTEGLSIPEEKISMSWGNRGISFRWRRIFNPQIYGDFIGVCSNFFTHFNYENLIDTSQNIKLNEDITSISAKADFTYLLNSAHTLELGVQEENLKVQQNWEVTESFFGSPLQSSNLISVYLQDRWQIMPPVLFIQPGLRGLYYTLGRRLLYNPRLGLKYRYSEDIALNVSAGKYNQFLVTINSQESYFSIFDFWRPVDSIHLPPVSYHLVGGIEKWFDEMTYCTVEGYYKKYYNLLIPKEEDIFFSTPTESLKSGSGYATGIDFFYKRNFRFFTFWLGYSFCWTRRSVLSESYFPRYDRRHNLNITLGSTVPRIIPFLRNGRLSLHWYFGSGLPYSDMVARYRYYTFWDAWSTPYVWKWDWRYISGPRDCYRLPVAHRLDLHYEKGLRLFGLNGEWWFDVMNVYAQKNILFYVYELDETDDELKPPKKRAYSILPIAVPSFGITIRF